MSKTLLPLLLFFIVLGACSSDSDEDIVKPIPEIFTISSNIVLPGDTISVLIKNFNKEEIQSVSVNSIPSQYETDAQGLNIIIPINVIRGHKAPIEIKLTNETLLFEGLEIANIITGSVDRRLVTKNDTLIFTGSGFAKDINSLVLNFEDANSQLALSLNIIELKNDEISATIPEDYAWYDYNFKDLIPVISTDLNNYSFNETLNITSHYEVSEKYNTYSVAPGCLFLINYYNVEDQHIKTNTIIEIGNSSFEYPGFDWAIEEENYTSHGFVVPENISIGSNQKISVSVNNIELIAKSSDIIQVEEPTYTFTPSSFDKTKTHDITFNLSHVYLDNSYTVKLISQLNGEEVWEWSGGIQVEQNILEDGTGIELTVTAYDLTFDGSYYVQITAGLESYELSPAGNNVITFE
ncbi:MAG: hypothetical protein ABJH05_18495 [Fulvivirga sp.]